jgi:hypothetical protein
LSAAIAEKVLVNDAAEMLGAGAELLELADDDVAELDVELELELELPQPAISAAATNVGAMARFQTAMKALLLDTRTLVTRPLVFGSPWGFVTISHSSARFHRG